MIPPQGAGWYWLCENEAWKVLPLDKDGACALGAVIPHITMLDNIGDQNEKMNTHGKRMKRSIKPIVERSTTFHSVVRALIPSLGVFELERAIINISAVIEHIENRTIDAIKALQEEVHGLSRVVLQNRMALDFLLASQGGVCKVINTSCCSYVDQSGRIKKDLTEIQKQTQILHQVTFDDKQRDIEGILHTLTSWSPNWTWLKWLFILFLFVISVGMIAHGTNQCCRYYAPSWCRVR